MYRDSTALGARKKKGRTPSTADDKAKPPRRPKFNDPRNEKRDLYIEFVDSMERAPSGGEHTLTNANTKSATDERYPAETAEMVELLEMAKSASRIPGSKIDAILAQPIWQTAGGKHGSSCTAASIVNGITLYNPNWLTRTRKALCSEAKSLIAVCGNGEKTVDDAMNSVDSADRARGATYVQQWEMDYYFPVRCELRDMIATFDQLYELQEAEDIPVHGTYVPFYDTSSWIDRPLADRAYKLTDKEVDDIIDRRFPTNEYVSELSGLKSGWFRAGLLYADQIESLLDAGVPVPMCIPEHAVCMIGRDDDYLYAVGSWGPWTREYEDPRFDFRGGLHRIPRLWAYLNSFGFIDLTRPRS